LGEWRVVLRIGAAFDVVVDDLDENDVGGRRDSLDLCGLVHEVVDGRPVLGEVVVVVLVLRSLAEQP
jgi:hypothetical protein